MDDDTAFETEPKQQQNKRNRRKLKISRWKPSGQHNAVIGVKDFLQHFFLTWLYICKSYKAYCGQAIH